MKKLNIKNNFQGAYSVAETQNAANKEPVRTLTPLKPYGHNKPAMRGRPLCPDVGKDGDICAGSTPAAPPIEKAKPRSLSAEKVKLRSVEDVEEKVMLRSLDDHARAVLRKALRGLDRRVSGFSIREKKIVYEYDDGGKREVKNETVTTKKVLPDMSAIVFTLTNLDGKRWRNKPDGAAENPFVTEDDAIDLSQVPEDILQILQATAYGKRD